MIFFNQRVSRLGDYKPEMLRKLWKQVKSEILFHVYKIQRIFQDDFCKLALNLTFENRMFVHFTVQRYSTSVWILKPFWSLVCNIHGLSCRASSSGRKGIFQLLSGYFLCYFLSCKQTPLLHSRSKVSQNANSSCSISVIN